MNAVAAGSPADLGDLALDPDLPQLVHPVGDLGVDRPTGHGLSGVGGALVAARGGKPRRSRRRMPLLLRRDPILDHRDERHPRLVARSSVQQCRQIIGVDGTQLARNWASVERSYSMYSTTSGTGTVDRGNVEAAVAAFTTVLGCRAVQGEPAGGRCRVEMTGSSSDTGLRFGNGRLRLRDLVFRLGKFCLGTHRLRPGGLDCRLLGFRLLRLRDRPRLGSLRGSATGGSGWSSRASAPGCRSGPGQLGFVVVEPCPRGFFARPVEHQLECQVALDGRPAALLQTHTELQRASPSAVIGRVTTKVGSFASPRARSRSDLRRMRTV